MEKNKEIFINDLKEYVNKSKSNTALNIEKNLNKSSKNNNLTKEQKKQNLIKEIEHINNKQDNMLEKWEHDFCK